WWPDQHLHARLFDQDRLDLVLEACQVEATKVRVHGEPVVEVAERVARSRHLPELDVVVAVDWAPDHASRNLGPEVGVHSLRTVARGAGNLAPYEPGVAVRARLDLRRGQCTPRLRIAKVRAVDLGTRRAGRHVHVQLVVAEHAGVREAGDVHPQLIGTWTE